jgi:hypothetical protein
MSGVAMTASKSSPAAFDLGHHVFAADKISAGFFGFFDLVALGDYENTVFDLPRPCGRTSVPRTS